jgi:hypothetical protein
MGGKRRGGEERKKKSRKKNEKWKMATVEIELALSSVERKEAK